MIVVNFRPIFVPPTGNIYKKKRFRRPDVSGRLFLCRPARGFINEHTFGLYRRNTQ
jgi:hypothetical protein